MADSNFYDELDLRYPEMALCLDRIDRTNPGTKRFYIPILTPNVDTSSLNETKQTVRQNSSIIDNQDPVNISSVQVTNCLNITIPKELCAFVGGDFHVKNVGNMTFTTKGNISGNGTVGPPTSYSALSASVSNYSGTKTQYKGILNSIPTDEYRYIEKGSKWIVVFIGGDITCPQLVGRYTEPAS